LGVVGHWQLEVGSCQREARRVRLTGMSLPHDIRHAVRLIRKAPWFTAASVSVLGLGIGATTAIFSLIDAALLRPLPHPDAHQLVMIWERSAQNPRAPVSLATFADWSNSAKSLSGVAASAGIVQIPIARGADEVPESIPLDSVTPSFFTVLRVTPLLGRVPDDSNIFGPGRSDGGIAISERLWRTRFAADPSIVGSTIRIASPPRAVPVVGILPAGFQPLGTTDIWEVISVEGASNARATRVLRVIGRLGPDTTLDQASAELNVIARNIEQAYPATNKGWGVTIQPLQAAIVGADLRTTSLVLGGVVLFVLLLACANVANLILARGVGRTRELAVRAALGGTRLRIARQLLVECLFLGVLGGLAGVAMAWALLRAVPSFIPPQTIPPSIVLMLDWRLAAFASAATVLTALLFGLAPAWQAARVSLVEAMNIGGRGSSDRAGRVRQTLAVAEIAIALLLMTGAGLLVRTLISLNNVDAGYRADNVVTMNIRLPFRRLITAKPGEIETYWRSIEREVASIPAVRSASLGFDLPLGGTSINPPFDVVGRPTADPANRPSAHYQIVGPRYFETLGIQVVSGRAFTERDSENAPQVAIVSDAFVRRFLEGQNPIGARIVVSAPGVRFQAITREIVGIARQVKTRPDEPVDATYQVYVPAAQSPWIMANLIVRTAGSEPLQAVEQVKRAIARVDPTQAVSQIRTMEQIAEQSTARSRLRAQLVVAFAALATLLAAVGIFSVLMFMVQQRAREFSVRLAVGANAGDLLRLVLGGGLKLTAIGVVIGVAASAALVQSLASLLFGVPPFDPLTFVVAPLALTVVALLACLAPAIRALRADPVAALRAE
jgi:putative ABC transport system permease protein